MKSPAMNKSKAVCHIIPRMQMKFVLSAVRFLRWSDRITSHLELLYWTKTHMSLKVKVINKGLCCTIAATNHMWLLSP